MEEESSFLNSAARTIFDWVLALSLTAAGFWMLSWWRTPTLPNTAPDWTLASIDGKDVSLSDYEGQTIVMNFWATWCGPCKSEIPEFRKFVREHPNIPVLGIAVDGSVSKLRQFAKQNRMNYPVLRGDRGIQEDYKVSSLPMTVIVGPDGQIDDVHIGMMLYSQLEWATNP